jgi:hypothetical protein
LVAFSDVAGIFASNKDSNDATIEVGVARAVSAKQPPIMKMKEQTTAAKNPRQRISEERK